MKDIKALPGVQNCSAYRNKILLRVDFNVPVDGGCIQDTTRIRRVIPTVECLIEKGAKVIIISHLGRPKGKDMEFSFEPLVPAISDILGKSITFIGSEDISRVNTVVESLPWGSVILLENLRFHEGEENNDPDFARKLASFANIYVNDAFSCYHRKHASVNAITKMMPTFAGLSLQEELKHLGSVVKDHPVAAIIGGAKASTKIPVLRNLARKVDYLVLGGGVANTFLLYKGLNVGNSLCDKCLDDVDAVYEEAKTSGCNIVLPVDHVVAKNAEAMATTKDNGSVSEEDCIFDIGKETSEVIAKVLSGCRTILWNGPMGLFEKSSFIGGTSDLVRMLVDCKKERGAAVILGGGESILAMRLLGYSESNFTYVSTGGGALLHFLSNV
ncbi:phosphoglycerate kinase [Anaplasma bovis]|uniref:phosphoglycerate kinase n=1 Tax=Anaplasma bovis TaxID=186733 RepID=UPI002FF26315